MKRLTLESFNDLRINISGCLACSSSFVAIQKDSHEVSSNCHPTQKQWSRKDQDTCVIKYVYRVYYNLDWYTYCFLKGDIRRPWKIWSCQVDRRFEHGHAWATPRSCHGARKLATIRCVDFLHFGYFSYFFFVFAMFFHILLSLAFVSRFFSIFLFRCMLDCAEVCTTACITCQFATQRYTDKAVMQLNKAVPIQDSSAKS